MLVPQVVDWARWLFSADVFFNKLFGPFRFVDHFIVIIFDEFVENDDSPFVFLAGHASDNREFFALGLSRFREGAPEVAQIVRVAVAANTKEVVSGIKGFSAEGSVIRVLDEVDKRLEL